MSSAILIAGIWESIFCVLLLLMALFLILLVLVQRGRGGGLSGAFGGAGGQSAFGTKAGDTFTRITIVAATVWIVFCILGAKYLGQPQSRFESASQGTVTPPPDGVGNLGSPPDEESALTEGLGGDDTGTPDADNAETPGPDSGPSAPADSAPTGTPADSPGDN